METCYITISMIGEDGVQAGDLATPIGLLELGRLIFVRRYGYTWRGGGSLPLHTYTLG